MRIKKIILFIPVFLIGCAFSGSSFRHLERAYANEAIVYIYKNHGFVGSLMGKDIYIDNKKIGVLRNGNYFALHIKPGRHTIMIDESTFFHENYITKRFVAKNHGYYFIRVDYVYNGKTQMLSGPTIIPVPVPTLTQINKRTALQELYSL